MLVPRLLCGRRGSGQSLLDRSDEPDTKSDQPQKLTERAAFDPLLPDCQLGVVLDPSQEIR